MNKPTVLIADDNEQLLDALQARLARHGYNVITCTDGYSALAKARQFRPDVMVLDVRMPAGNGFTVQQRMREVDELRDIPVIYVTGEQSARLDAYAQQLGARCLLHKPINLKALMRAIDSVARNDTLEVG